MVGNFDQQVFSSYEKIDVRPYQINRSKEEHEKAVYELCKDLAEMIKKD